MNKKEKFEEQLEEAKNNLAGLAPLSTMEDWLLRASTAILVAASEQDDESGIPLGKRLEMQKILHASLVQLMPEELYQAARIYAAYGLQQLKEEDELLEDFEQGLDDLLSGNDA